MRIHVEAQDKIWIESRSFILQASSAFILSIHAAGASRPRTPSLSLSGSLSLSKHCSFPCLRATPVCVPRRQGRRANGKGREHELQKNHFDRISAMPSGIIRVYPVHPCCRRKPTPHSIAIAIEISRLSDTSQRQIPNETSGSNLGHVGQPRKPGLSSFSKILRQSIGNGSIAIAIPIAIAKRINPGGRYGPNRPLQNPELTQVDDNQ